MKLLRLIATSIISLLIGGLIGYYFGFDTGFEKAAKKTISNFEECTLAGNPVMESYPRRCNANGQSFTEDIGNELEKTDLLRLDSPRPNEVVVSPLEITGEARGTWFFEASFPVYLYDGEGQELAVLPAQAQGEWMTEDFVPFSVILQFKKPQTKTGELVLKKDNPSGLPELDDELRIPVRFD